MLCDDGCIKITPIIWCQSQINESHRQKPCQFDRFIENAMDLLHESSFFYVDFRAHFSGGILAAALIDEVISNDLKTIRTKLIFNKMITNLMASQYVIDIYCIFMILPIEIDIFRSIRARWFGILCQINLCTIYINKIIFSLEFLFFAWIFAYGANVDRMLSECWANILRNLYKNLIARNMRF